jgi:hypothetical protein
MKGLRMPEPNEVKTELQTAPAKVTFSEAQQQKIDELIRSAMGRAGNEARATAARLEAEAEVLRGEVARLTGDKSGLETTLEAKQRETTSAKAETIAVKKQNAITEAGAKYNFYNPAQLAKLTGDEITWNGKQFVVLGEDGTPRVGVDGSTPLSVDEFFREFATKNPHLVKGDVKPGIGSREAQQPPHRTLGEKEKLAKLFGRGSDGKAANDLALSDPNEYKRLRHNARRIGLI